MYIINQKNLSRTSIRRVKRSALIDPKGPLWVVSEMTRWTCINTKLKNILHNSHKTFKIFILAPPLYCLLTFSALIQIWQPSFSKNQTDLQDVRKKAINFFIKFARGVLTTHGFQIFKCYGCNFYLTQFRRDCYTISCGTDKLQNQPKFIVAQWAEKIFLIFSLLVPHCF